MFYKKFKGFTLTELLVVATIFAVLTSLFLSGLAMVRKEAQTVVCMNNLRQLGLAFQLYAADNRSRFPFPNASYQGSGDSPELCWYNALDEQLSGFMIATTTNQASEHWGFIKQDPVIRRLGEIWLKDAHTLKMNEWLSFDPQGTTGSKYFWSTADFPKPGLTVLLFDGKAEMNMDSAGLPGTMARQTQGTEGNVMRRHSDRANVLFVDGHVGLQDQKHQVTGDRLGWKVNETKLIWKPWVKPPS